MNNQPNDKFQSPPDTEFYLIAKLFAFAKLRSSKSESSQAAATANANIRLQNTKNIIFKIDQISLKPMQEDRSRCVVFGGIADLSVRPLSVEF